MSYLATYINEFQFSVPTDVVAELRIGTVIAVMQGSDGTYIDYISVSEYNAGDDLTLVTVELGGLTSNLTEIRRGPCFVDPTAQESNLSQHGHSARWDGGYKPYSKFTDDNGVDNLLVISAVSENVANKIVGVNPTGTALERKTLQGTTKQIAVDLSTPGEVTLSTPQDIDATATPTFGGMTLTGVSGVVLARAGVLSALMPAANQIVRRKADNTDFEVCDFAFMNLKDVNPLSWTDGMVPMWNASLGKFVPTAMTGGGGGDGSSNIFDLYIMQHVMGGGAGSQTASDIQPEDIPVSDLYADDMRINNSPNYYTPEDTPSTTDAARVGAHFQGIDTALGALNSPPPDPRSWFPPDFYWNPADQGAIILAPGRYYTMGYRVGGCYERTSRSYWDISTPTSYNLETCMSAKYGLYPPQGFWYAVFLVNSGGSFAVQFLPLIRVLATGSSKQVTFALHNTKALTADNLWTIPDGGDDMWNNYRMVGLGRGSRLANLGIMHTIADSWPHSNPLDSNTACGVNFDPLETTTMPVAGDWLMMIPPASSTYVYVGTVFAAILSVLGSVDFSIIPVRRKRWNYRWLQAYDLNSTFEVTCHADTPGLTYLCGETDMPQCPPNADQLNMSLWMTSGTTEVTALYASFYNSDSDAAPDPWSEDLAGFSICDELGTAMTRSVQTSVLWDLAGDDVIKAFCSMTVSDVATAADTAMIVADSYSE